MARGESCVVEISIGNSIEIAEGETDEETDADVEEKEAHHSKEAILLVLLCTFRCFYCTRTSHLVIFFEELPTVVWI